METLQVLFGDPVYVRYSTSMYIYSNCFTDRLKSLMYELTPCIYHESLRCYEASTLDLDYLKRRCLEMNVNLIVVESTTEEPEKQEEKVSKFEYKTKPFEHQIAGVEFGMTHNRFLLGDDMGLGKTKQIIDLAVKKKIELGYKHCLIICGVNGLKWNWESEIRIHSNEKSMIIGNRINTKGKYYQGSSKDKLEDVTNIPDDVYFIITNVETLRNTKISDVLKKLCDENIINMVAFDEFHVCNNVTSQQGKGLLKLSAESMVAMTGSPVMNSPLDMYMPLRWLGYDRHDFRDFKNHFCRSGGYGGGEIIGYKNMDQIQELLKIMMIRRLKGDVLDLPEKTYVTEYVEMDAEQINIYNEVVNDVRQNVDLIAKSKNPLANLIRLRQATGHTSVISSKVSKSAKMTRLCELVKDYTDNGHKLVIFSNWVKMIEILLYALKEYNPACITGDTKDRVEEQNRFTNDPDCKIILGTIGAMGTGLTLTAADVVLFLDEPWTAAAKRQAEDRIHRIGMKDSATIVTLITKYTIDERIHDLVERKGGISDALIDNLDCNNITALLNFLIS